jgi:UBX domain-containing protein 1
MSSEWNVEAAVALWYQSQEEETEEQDEEMDDEPSATYPRSAIPDHTAGTTGGGRTLGGGPPSSQPASSSQTSNRKPQGGMKTLQDLQKASSGRPDHDHDDDDDDHGQDMFAGGEKSGLAVENPGQNPRDLMERLLRRAREYVPSGFCHCILQVLRTSNSRAHASPVRITC